MKFGRIPVDEAEGAVLAHALAAGGVHFRKAHRLNAADLVFLSEADVTHVTVAILDKGDLDENAAATRLAQGFVNAQVEAREAATGRVNLYAQTAGLFTVDKEKIDAFNRVDPAITLATLAPFTAVEKGQMVATIKIIPFAVAQQRVMEAETVIGADGGLIVRPFTPCRVGLIQTVLASVKESVLDKTSRITGERLARSQSSLGRELRALHDEDAVGKAIQALLPESDMLIIFGASAVCDDADVIPAAIRSAGGQVERVGMPVDPGNLLVLGSLGGKPVLGAPGCARSPKQNGFDWVLDRLMAGLEVASEDIAAMGVGGLLGEISARPQPRDRGVPEKRPVVWGVLLAAGQSRRMGLKNKLLADFSGVPLVRRTGEQLANSIADGAIVVLGHEARAVSNALAGLGLAEVINADFADGLSTSLKSGVQAIPHEADGALIMLGDMPEIMAADLDRLIAAFRAAGGGSVIRATHNGKRGNPVILPRALFAKVEQLQGDTGARHVVEEGIAPVIDVEIGKAASVDIDTPEAMEKAGGVLTR